MNFLDRCQEWLADRISWVQYPNIRATAGEPSGVVFRHRISWQGRLALLLFGAVTVVMSCGLLVLIGAVVIGAVKAS